MSKALDIQVGGSHYKNMKIQPMEFSMANGLDACQHTIIKYVARFRDKGGIEDLKKAQHCIDMLIEFEQNAASEKVLAEMPPGASLGRGTRPSWATHYVADESGSCHFVKQTDRPGVFVQVSDDGELERVFTPQNYVTAAPLRTPRAVTLPEHYKPWHYGQEDRLYPTLGANMVKVFTKNGLHISGYAKDMDWSDVLGYYLV